MKDGCGVVVGCGQDTRHKSEVVEEGGGGACLSLPFGPRTPCGYLCGSQFFLEVGKAD